MKATDFVKKFGIDNAIIHIKNMEAVQLGDCMQDYIDDLKQIVEAFELIDRFGGLFSAKVSLNKEGYTGGIECGDDLIDDDQLKKAINIVEQCNA